MHYYQYNIADYRKDTTHLTLLEHGCYRQLIDQYYLNEVPLPIDENKLFRLLSARSDDEKNAIKNVLNDFFTKTESGYVHSRCQIEIEQYHLKSESASKSAKSRWSQANALQTHSERNANHKPITINHKPLTNINTIGDFDRFWNEYPKKTGKGAALKSWTKMQPNIDDCLKALSWQKKTSQWFKNNGQFIPNPATWINQERWKDEPTLEASF